MSPNVVLMPILKKKKMVVLSPQHPQQQQHQPTVSGQFQPHAQAEDLVSDTTEYATAAPVLISQSIASSHFSPPTPHRLCTSCFSPPTHHPGHFSAPPHTAPSRLHSNNLQCDCHVAWLSEWLRQRPRLGLYTQCMAPPHLRGHNVAEAQKKEFVCTG